MVREKRKPTGSLSINEDKARYYGKGMKAARMEEAKELKCPERMYRFSKTEDCPYKMEGLSCTDLCTFNPDDVIDCVTIADCRCPLEYAPIAEELVIEIHDRMVQRPKASADRTLTKYHLIEHLFPNTRFRRRNVK